MNFGHSNIIFVLLILVGCSSSHSQQMVSTEKWSQQLADAVLARNDSLSIYNNPSSVKWQYDIAMLGQAIARVNSNSDVYNDYHKNYIDLFIDDDGSINTYVKDNYNIDNYNPAKGLFSLYRSTGELKYKMAIELLVKRLDQHPRIAGGFCHKDIYPNQIWLNSVYMVGPFIAQYAAEFDQPQWFDSICFQLENTYRLLVDNEDGLLFHAWDASKIQNWADAETGKSPHKWSRGIGWYMMALVDVLEFLPEDHPDRDSIIKILRDSSDALLKVRDDETGLWYQIANLGDKEYNYIETSGSAMFIYSFAKGVNLKVLPNKYNAIAKDAFGSLIQNYIKTDSDNLPTLTHISGPAGLGVKLHRDGSFEYYINQKQIDNDPKGMAPLILAACELDL